MICKYLDWRDVGNMKKALPQISVSGAVLDVVKRSLDKISNKKNVIEEDIVCTKSELERIREHYFYSLFNPHYFTPHDIMHLIWVYQCLKNHEMHKDREKLELDWEMKEIHRWWLGDE